MKAKTMLDPEINSLDKEMTAMKYKIIDSLMCKLNQLNKVRLTMQEMSSNGCGDTFLCTSTLRLTMNEGEAASSFMDNNNNNNNHYNGNSFACDELSPPLLQNQRSSNRSFMSQSYLQSCEGYQLKE